VTGRFDIESLRQRLNPESSVQGSEKSDERLAAVAVIIDMNREGGSTLLIRRQDRAGDPWSGQVAFPGGHKSSSDQTLLDTAIREASEEVGIELRAHVTLGVLPLEYSHVRGILVTPFVFQLKHDEPTRLSGEVAESFWLPLNDLSKNKSTRSEVRVQDDTLHVDSYVVGDHVIWGLTFRIVNSLLKRA